MDYNNMESVKMDVPLEEQASQYDSRFVGINELIQDVPPPDWLVYEFLERNTMAQIAGKHESAKSLQALDWALRVATGTAWNGYDIDKAPVAYICGEGYTGMRRRIVGWANHNGIDLSDAPFIMTKTGYPLTDSDQCMDTFADIDKQLDQPPALIVIDTLARNFSGNENSTEDMTTFVNNVDKYLRLPFEACVLILHHTGHADRDTGRGSTVLIGACDAAFHMKNDTGNVTLSCTKMKDADHPKPVGLQIISMEVNGVDKYGQPMTAPVLRPGDGSKLMAVPVTGKNQKNLMTMVKALHPEYAEDCTESEPVWIPHERLRNECLDIHMDRRRYSEAVKGLVKRKAIESNEVHLRLI